MRLIDADALKYRREDYGGYDDVGVDERKRGILYLLKKDIAAAPTIEPVKHGKWVKKMEVIKTEKFDAFTPKWYCPYCGKESDPAVVKAVGIKFCYECGAKMERSEE